MATGHPVDAAGRTLPRCDWPSDRQAPGTLEFVRRFCNTTNLESGADRFVDPDDHRAWMVEQQVAAFTPTTSDIECLTAVRETIRRAAIAHRDRRSDRDEIVALRDAFASVTFTLDPESANIDVIVSRDQPPIRRLLGALAIAIADAQRDGTWERLKACRHCRWVVFDRSKNNSGLWCSMSACGGRAKVADHRARRRAATT